MIAGLLLYLLGPESASIVPSEMYPIWKSWPGVLISFLFVGLLLGDPPAAPGASGDLARPVLQQTIMVWFIALGQLCVGFACALGLHQLIGSTPLVAHIVEIGWIGGHGSAAALTAVMEGLSMRAVGDLALFSATVGLVWGGLSGIVLVNYLRRQDPDHFAHDVEANAEANAEAKIKASRTHDARTNATAAGSRSGDDPAARVAGESERDLWPALLIMILTVGAAYLMRFALAFALEKLVSPGAARFTARLPTFFIAILISAFLRRALPPAVLSAGTRADLRRFTGIVLDVLIIAAVATLSLKTFFQFLTPFLVLMTAGALWCLSVLLFFAPRMLPGKYWRELGILNYGMSTGVTALGLLLLRSLRPTIPPEVARVYGLAAPFSAPFIGGGVISLLLPEVTARGGGPLVFGTLLVCVVGLFIAGRTIARRST